MSILQLRAKPPDVAAIRIKLFVIDYLQLLHSTARRAENRQQEIADISNGVKALAKELKVPSSFSASSTRDGEGQEPPAADVGFAESGSIEQDADFVGLLYKPNAMTKKRMPLRRRP